MVLHLHLIDQIQKKIFTYSRPLTNKTRFCFFLTSDFCPLWFTAKSEQQEPHHHGADRLASRGAGDDIQLPAAEPSGTPGAVHGVSAVQGCGQTGACPSQDPPSRKPVESHAPTPPDPSLLPVQPGALPVCQVPSGPAEPEAADLCSAGGWGLLGQDQQG